LKVNSSFSVNSYGEQAMKLATQMQRTKKKTQTIAGGVYLKTLFVIVAATILCRITIPEGISVIEPAIIFIMF
jgi:hypothetical protein